MPELPGGPQHGAQVGDVHLHHGDLGGGAGGQQRGAGGLCSARVPARQAQVEPVVLLQQPLAERSADATGGVRHGTALTHRVPNRTFSPAQSPGGQRCRGRPGTLRAGPSDPDPPPRPPITTESSPARPGDQDHLPHRGALTLRGEVPTRLSETQSSSPPGPASPLCPPIRAGDFRTAPPRNPIRIQDSTRPRPSRPSNQSHERSASWWGEIGRGAGPRDSEPRANPGSAASAAQVPRRDSSWRVGELAGRARVQGHWHARGRSVFRPLRLTVDPRRPRGICSTGKFRDDELKLGDCPPSRCPFLFTRVDPALCPFPAHCCSKTSFSKQSPLEQ